MLEAGHPDYLLGKRTLKPAVDGRVSGILGGSWAVITGVSRVTILITPIRGLITLLITTHEPPSRVPHSGSFKMGILLIGVFFARVTTFLFYRLL